jgi:hypothetical protein
MQRLADAGEVQGTARMYRPDADAVDAVLTASRSLVAVATRSLGAAAEETTIAQYRALVVLASRGPQRIVDLAAALDVAPSTARRRALIETILATLPEDAQRAVAEALRAFADAAGEVPDSQWPSPEPAEEAVRPRMPDHLVHTDEGGRP